MNIVVATLNALHRLRYLTSRSVSVGEGSSLYRWQLSLGAADNRVTIGRHSIAHPLHHLYAGENALLLREDLRAIRQAGFRDVCVRSPFENAINLAPNTPATILRGLAERISGGNRVLLR